MGMLLNLWILGMLLTFVYSMWVNHKSDADDKANMMEMALASVMWPFWVLWKVGHKLMSGDK